MNASDTRNTQQKHCDNVQQYIYVNVKITNKKTLPTTHANEVNSLKKKIPKRQMNSENLQWRQLNKVFNLFHANVRFMYLVKILEKRRFCNVFTQPTFTCSKLTTETSEKGVKYIQI